MQGIFPMVKILFLLLCSSAYAAPVVQPQDIAFSTFQVAGISVGTTTAPTTAESVYGVITSSTIQGTVACSAGTPILTAGSSDQIGAYSAGTLATNCTYTFKRAWPKTPVCFCASDAATPISLSSLATTTTVKCSAAAALTGDNIFYFCWGPP